MLFGVLERDDIQLGNNDMAFYRVQTPLVGMIHWV